MSNSTPLTPDGVLEAALYARDLPAAERFYGDVLGLRVIAHQPGRHVFFRCGRTVLLVFNPETTANDGTTIGGKVIPKHGTHGAGHVAFGVEADSFSVWRDRLQECGVAIETEINWPQGGHSLYFRDPAGNSVEFATSSIWPQLADSSDLAR